MTSWDSEYLPVMSEAMLGNREEGKTGATSETKAPSPTISSRLGVSKSCWPLLYRDGHKDLSQVAWFRVPASSGCGGDFAQPSAILFDHPCSNRGGIRRARSARRPSWAWPPRSRRVSIPRRRRLICACTAFRRRIRSEIRRSNGHR